MSWIALGALMTVGPAHVVLTLARAPVAARLAKIPEDVPRVAISLAVTSFHLVMGRIFHRQWVGGAAGETAELYAQAYRERAWIVGWAVAPPGAGADRTAGLLRCPRHRRRHRRGSTTGRHGPCRGHPPS